MGFVAFSDINLARRSCQSLRARRRLRFDLLQSDAMHSATPRRWVNRLYVKLESAIAAIARSYKLLVYKGQWLAVGGI